MRCGTSLLKLLLASLALALVLAPQALAAGGDYVIDGGTPSQRTQVRSALEASSFDWGVVPGRVTIHVASGVPTRSLPGHIWLDAGLLDAGRFSWAVVQDEYAHQVDFALFDAATRARLTQTLGASAWCREVAGLAHGAYGCERFSSTLVWAYWPSRANAYRPSSPQDESAAMEPARFRALMNELVGAPRFLSKLTPRR